MKLYFKDAVLWFFGLIALSCFVVSAPATYVLVSLYHNDGSDWGQASTFSLILILELGAVAAKLATLTVKDRAKWLSGICIAFLTVNAFSNWLNGLAVAAVAQPPEQLRWLQSGWALWIGSVVYAAFVPALLYLMLHLFVQRVQQLRGDAADSARMVQRTMQPVQQAVEQTMLLMQAMQRLQSVQPAFVPSPWPESLKMPIAVRRVQPMPDDAEYACKKCGALVEGTHAMAASARWGCAACKQSAEALKEVLNGRA